MSHVVLIHIAVFVALVLTPGLALLVVRRLRRRGTYVNVSHDAVVEALEHAFAAAGLPAHELRGDYDLAATGKLNEVIAHASWYLERQHPLRTVHDVATFLRQSA